MKEWLLNEIIDDVRNGYKVKVNNPNESTLVQTALFSLGFSWGRRGQTVLNINSHYLTLRLGYGGSRIISDREITAQEWFDRFPFKEVTVDDIVGYDYTEYFHYRKTNFNLMIT